jgi:ABC-type nitrate/sulfonate/bicarbonate transport system ATPase subunit
MRFFPSDEALGEALAVCAQELGPSLAMVARDVPLLSNLDVWANIALIKQYHENMPAAKAERLVLGYLRRYDMEEIAYRRSPSLTAEERFCAMLLRAVCVQDAVVLIDRPFLLLPHLKDAARLFEMLAVISDLYVRCLIFDYTWDEERYEVNHAAHS